MIKYNALDKKFSTISTELDELLKIIKLKLGRKINTTQIIPNTRNAFNLIINYINNNKLEETTLGYLSEGNIYLIIGGTADNEIYISKINEFDKSSGGIIKGSSIFIPKDSNIIIMNIEYPSEVFSKYYRFFLVPDEVATKLLD